PERISQLEISTAGGRDILLAIELIAHWWGIASRASDEVPQYFSSLRVKCIEVAIPLAGEYQTAGRRERATDHGLVGLMLPRDLPSVEIDRGECAVLGLTGNGLKSGAEPELPFVERRRVRDVVHGLLEAHHVGVAERRVDGHRRPLRSAIGARQHPR